MKIKNSTNNKQLENVKRKCLKKAKIKLKLSYPKCFSRDQLHFCYINKKSDISFCHGGKNLNSKKKKSIND